MRFTALIVPLLLSGPVGKVLHSTTFLFMGGVATGKLTEIVHFSPITKRLGKPYINPHNREERELMCASVCVWMYEGSWEGWSQARRICRFKEGEDLVCGGMYVCVDARELLPLVDAR